jgi:quercetin dioxygenase-like cupin family protein
MEKSSLSALAREQLKIARQASSGRSAKTVYGGHEHVLRQTLIALAAGHRLDEHDNPGEATVHVLHGRVRLSAGEIGWEGSPGVSSSCPSAGTPSRRSKTPRCCSPWPSTADTAAVGATV